MYEYRQNCRHCSREFSTAAPAVWCSPSCRGKANRARAKAELLRLREIAASREIEYQSA